MSILNVNKINPVGGGSYNQTALKFTRLGDT